jgi:hypothetical protein
MTTLSNEYIGQVPAVDTELYTPDTNMTGRVIKCTATNDTTTSQTISFHKVPSGGTAGDDNLILNEKLLRSKETWGCPEVVGQVLTAGMSISAIAGGADQVTVSLDVVEVIA